MDNFAQNNDRIEFRVIVLTHIKNVLNLSLRTNNDGQKLNLYISSVDALADVLISYYDETMNEKYNSIENKILALRKENNKQMKELSPHSYSNQYEGIYTSTIRRLYRELFRELNLLMKRVDYLKATIYGDSETNDDIIEDSTGGEE